MTSSRRQPCLCRGVLSAGVAAGNLIKLNSEYPHVQINSRQAESLTSDYFEPQKGLARQGDS